MTTCHVFSDELDFLSAMTNAYISFLFMTIDSCVDNINNNSNNNDDDDDDDDIYDDVDDDDDDDGNKLFG